MEKKKPYKSPRAAAENREKQRRRTANWRKSAEKNRIGRIEVWVPLQLREGLRKCLPSVGLPTTPREGVERANKRVEWEALLHDKTGVEIPPKEAPLETDLFGTPLEKTKGGKKR
jgi:hypothetical protein